MSSREVPLGTKIEKAEFVFAREEFTITEHNYLCAVCRDDSAVLDNSFGILQPCRGCMERGFFIFKVGNLARFLHKLGWLK